MRQFWSVSLQVTRVGSTTLYRQWKKILWCGKRKKSRRRKNLKFRPQREKWWQQCFGTIWEFYWSNSCQRPLLRPTPKKFKKSDKIETTGSFVAKKDAFSRQCETAFGEKDAGPPRIVQVGNIRASSILSRPCSFGLPSFPSTQTVAGRKKIQKRRRNQVVRRRLFQKFGRHLLPYRHRKISVAL